MSQRQFSHDEITAEEECPVCFEMAEASGDGYLDADGCVAGWYNLTTTCKACGYTVQDAESLISTNDRDYDRAAHVDFMLDVAGDELALKNWDLLAAIVLIGKLPTAIRSLFDEPRTVLEGLTVDEFCCLHVAVARLQKQIEARNRGLKLAA